MKLYFKQNPKLEILFDIIHLKHINVQINNIKEKILNILVIATQFLNNVI